MNECVEDVRPSHTHAHVYSTHTHTPMQTRAAGVSYTTRATHCSVRTIAMAAVWLSTRTQENACARSLTFRRPTIDIAELAFQPKFLACISHPTHEIFLATVKRSCDPDRDIALIWCNADAFMQKERIYRHSCGARCMKRADLHPLFCLPLATPRWLAATCRLCRAMWSAPIQGRLILGWDFCVCCSPD